MARAAYRVMEPITWFVLVPLALASLLTGVIQSLGTPWGLIRHYWVLFKLVLTILAVVILLLYTRTIDHIARIAADPTASIADLRTLRASPTLRAVDALLVLLTTTVLAVYKPRGMTPYGQRKQSEQRAEAQI